MYNLFTKAFLYLFVLENVFRCEGNDRVAIHTVHKASKQLHYTNRSNSLDGSQGGDSS